FNVTTTGLYHYECSFPSILPVILDEMTDAKSQFFSVKLVLNVERHLQSKVVAQDTRSFIRNSGSDTVVLFPSDAFIEIHKFIPFRISIDLLLQKDDLLSCGFSATTSTDSSLPKSILIQNMDKIPYSELTMILPELP